MTETLKRAEDVLDVLSRVDRDQIGYELRKLRAVRDWALRHIGVDYSVGDRVEIKRDLGLGRARTRGWWAYREALAPGATAVVEEIDFSVTGREWMAKIRLDREWSVHEDNVGVRRYWNGPVGQTPEGMIPPTPYDQEHYPNGRTHSFILRATDLRAHRDDGAGLE